ncbi:unnamed protein product [Laminaria digitata]
MAFAVCFRVCFTGCFLLSVLCALCLSVFVCVRLMVLVFDKIPALIESLKRCSCDAAILHVVGKSRTSSASGISQPLCATSCSWSLFVLLTAGGVRAALAAAVYHPPLLCTHYNLHTHLLYVYLTYSYLCYHQQHPPTHPP